MSDGNTAELWVPTGSVTVRVPGKVNLHLAVGDRREDGYHELTTVFQAVSLVDEATVRNSLTRRRSNWSARELMSCPLMNATRVQAAERLAEHVGRAPMSSIDDRENHLVVGGMVVAGADAAVVLVAMELVYGKLAGLCRDQRGSPEAGSDEPSRRTVDRAGDRSRRGAGYRVVLQDSPSATGVRPQWPGHCVGVRWSLTGRERSVPAAGRRAGPASAALAAGDL